jgi:2-(1,2-epoxy-1,2-dihydrophenyl)acetyl-CoA isomerase
MNNVEFTIGERGGACLALNRPSKLNALNIDLIQEITETLHDAATRDDVSALIVTGNGRGFCAGADLSIFSANMADGISAGVLVSGLMRDYFNPMMSAFYQFPRPLIMAINGIAAGGGVGIALCGDIVLAARSSALKVVQVPQLEIVADLGANWMLPRLAGRGRAMGMCLMGDTIAADKMEKWGLVWECVDDSELLPRAEEVARHLASVPAETVIATRNMVDASNHLTFEQLLVQERYYQRDLCDRSGFSEKVAHYLAGMQHA